MSFDFENQAEAEGAAISTSKKYELERPKPRRKAPLKPVPAHMRKKRRDHRPIEERLQKPCVDKVNVPDWVADLLGNS